MPKVSIIVPVYNTSKYLRKCLDSIVNQTISDIQIIVVNDGSTDNSADIIQEYSEKYPDKVIALTKANGGLSHARNYGLKYANGEYIGFVDSDDYIDINMYKEMYEKVVEENSDYVECDFYWIYPDKTRLDSGSIYNGKHEMLVDARVVAWNKLIKKEVLDKSGIEFPVGYRYEDAEFFYKLLPHLDKISFVKKPFIYYIQRDNSISNSQNERTKEIFDILDHVIVYYKENNIYQEYKEELEYIYTRYLLCSSLLRMVRIEDKEIRNKLLSQTWTNLNEKFPKWKKNKILKTGKGLKNLYMKTVNSVTFKIYCTVFRLLKRGM